MLGQCIGIAIGLDEVEHSRLSLLAEQRIAFVASFSPARRRKRLERGVKLLLESGQSAQRGKDMHSHKDGT
jgi:hypothetical protein